MLNEETLGGISPDAGSLCPHEATAMTDLAPTLGLLVALLERTGIKYVLMGGLIVRV